MATPDPPPPPDLTGAALPPAGPRRTRGLALVGAVVVTVVAIAAFLAGRGESRGPQDVVEDYVAAYTDGDCEAMVDLVVADHFGETSARTRDEALADCGSMVADQSPARLDLVRTVVTQNDPAPTTVVATFRDRGGEGPFDVTFTMAGEGDGWRIRSCAILIDHPCL